MRGNWAEWMVLGNHLGPGREDQARGSSTGRTFRQQRGMECSRASRVILARFLDGLALLPGHRLRRLYLDTLAHTYRLLVCLDMLYNLAPAGEGLRQEDVFSTRSRLP